MTEYLKREDVRRAVLHNEGDAVIAAIDELEPVLAVPIELLVEWVMNANSVQKQDDKKAAYEYIAGTRVDFKAEDLTDYGRELLCGKKRDEWIPVTERLPERADEVLIAYREEYDEWTEEYEVSTATYMPRAGRWDYDDLKITHWMPLPKPPEGMK